VLLSKCANRVNKTHKKSADKLVKDASEQKPSIKDRFSEKNERMAANVMLRNSSD